MRSLLRILLFLGALYVAGCAVVGTSQNSLLFFPVRYSEESLVKETREAGLLVWKDKSGNTIGVRTPPVPGNKALVVFHGNGGDALSRSFLRNFTREGWDLYLVEYPGYGSRPGTPGESSITETALQAVDLVDSDKLYLYGESLGTGVASVVAAARPERVKGMFLISPYPSLVAVAGAHYPWLPVSLLLKTRFNAKKALENYHGPIAMAVGAGDTTIPNRFGKELYESYAGPKHWWSVPDAGHNSAEILLQEWTAMEHWMAGQTHSR